jgi:hypothetical protein
LSGKVPSINIYINVRYPLAIFTLKPTHNLRHRSIDCTVPSDRSGVGSLCLFAKSALLATLFGVYRMIIWYVVERRYLSWLLLLSVAQS